MTSRDDSEYSKYCVIYDQVSNGIHYKYKILGDNVRMNRNFREFCDTFSRNNLRLAYTDEEGVFLGRVSCLKRFETGFEISSFLPSEFDKHVCNLMHAKTDLVSHASGIVNLADFYAMSRKKWQFFHDYYKLFMERLAVSGRDRVVKEAKIRFKPYHESLRLHYPRH
jgi:hypothetical protein